MITYPLDLPTAARARIERALVEAEAAITSALAQPVPLPYVCRRGVIFYNRPPGSADAVWTALVETCEAAIQAVGDTARDKPAWPVERLRAAADDLIEQIVAWMYHRQDSGSTTLADLTRRAHRALSSRAPWQQLQEMIRARTQPEALPRIGAQIAALRREAGWTIDELVEAMNAEAMHLDRRTVVRHLSGDTIPHPSNLRQYEKVFSKRLNRDISVEAPPRTPRTIATRAKRSRRRANAPEMPPKRHRKRH